MTLSQEHVKTIEIRWHGRGGQGAVTSAELVALAAINEGKYAQSFPSFGPERRGAPVLAFLRINDREPIRIRTDGYEPDVVVVLDPTLLHVADIASGLKQDGILIINTKKAEEIEYKFGERRVVTVNATDIAKEILGVPITNTTMVGALIRATQIVKLESMLEPLKHRFDKLAEKNFEAMKKAYEQTRIKE